MTPFFRTLSAVLLSLAAFSCSRNEPVTVVPDPVPGTASITPIASYSIGTHVAEPSGIVHHPGRNALLVVSDSHPEVVELSFTGTFLSAVSTVSADLEGVALSRTADSIYVVEERTRSVVTYSANGTKLSSFTADVSTLPNNGLEGITVGADGNLFVLNEKAPGMILEFTRQGTEVRRMTLTYALDYSGLFYDGTADCLWVVSDESKKVMKLSMTGALIKEWLLPFTKGEGITIVRDTMYIVNDADAKLYVFTAPH